MRGAAFVATTSNGLHFRSADGALTRYGVATFVDAEGHRTTIEPHYTDGAIDIVVPDKVLRAARYPAVLDPIISPEQSIDVPRTRSFTGESSPTIVAGPAGWRPAPQ